MVTQAIAVKVQIDDFCRQYSEAERGPALLVLGEYNLEDEYIKDAIENLELILKRPEIASPATLAEYRATKHFLEHLLTIPEIERIWYR